MEQVVGLSLLGSALALDHAMVGQFMISQPLVLGGIFGGLLGDLPLGLKLGALLQLIWIGVLPIGAFIPSDHTVTSGVTIILTFMLVQGQHWALESSMVLALCFSIPAGVVSGKLDILVRQGNNRIACWAENLVEKKFCTWAVNMNLLALLPAWARNFIVYLLWLGPGALLLFYLYPHLPAAVLRGLALTFWMLPALAFAVILDMLSKEGGWHWALAAGGAAILPFFLWPGQGWIILMLFAAAALILSWRSQS